MREIKFRLRNENNKIVGYEKWYAGAFNMETKKDYYVARPCWLYSKDNEYWNPTSIEHRYKDGFTCLLDKYGKEIYEGDVVKILYTDWPSCHGCHKDTDEHMNAIALVRIVIWSMQGFYVSHKPNGYAESMEPGKHGFIKVIGNIHEHPQLLKDAL